MDSIRRNAILYCHNGLSLAYGKASTDFSYIVSRKWRRPGVIVGSTSAFGIHVGDVVYSRSEEKMCWIHTDWVIADMAYKKAIGDGAKMNLPRYTVSRDIRGIRVNAASKPSVAAGRRRALPFPALFSRGWINVIPETFVKRNVGAVNIGMPRDVLVRFSLDVSSFGVIPGRKAGFFTTTAVAITVGNFLRGVLRGMLAHVESLLIEVGHATGCFQQRRGASIGLCYMSNYTIGVER